MMLNIQMKWSEMSNGRYLSILNEIKKICVSEGLLVVFATEGWDVDIINNMYNSILLIIINSFIF